MDRIFDLFHKIESKPAATRGQVTHLLVGLGNYGKEYLFTRHNTGFLMMDYLSQKAGVELKQLKFRALCADAVIADRHVLLMKPQTLMNLSGLAVREAAAFYRIPPENILVFSDDISLDVGRVRMRMSGSDGGQKGLRSIIGEIGSDAFPRIRFGIGAKPHPDYDLAAWVLSEFTKDEQKLLFAAFETAYPGVLKYLTGDPDGAVQTCNARPSK